MTLGKVAGALLQIKWLQVHMRCIKLQSSAEGQELH